MERILVKESIGEFFSKMYEANKGKRIEVSLRADSDKIAIYYKDKGTFDYLTLVDEQDDVNKLVELLSE